MACHRIHSPAISAAETAVYSATERSQFIYISEHHPPSLGRPISPPECPIIRELAAPAANLDSTSVTDYILTPLVTPATPTFRQQQEQGQRRSQFLNLAEVELKELIPMAIKHSKATAKTLVYALSTLDRLKEKWPRMVQGTPRR
jgi:hypothetical protein